MNVKIAMLVAASEYERLTLDAARSSAIEMPPQFVTARRTNNIADGRMMDLVGWTREITLNSVRHRVFVASGQATRDQ
jgi:hypothetical protein